MKVFILQRNNLWNLNVNIVIKRELKMAQIKMDTFDMTNSQFLRQKKSIFDFSRTILFIIVKNKAFEFSRQK